jgi:hypothetical protein
LAKPERGVVVYREAFAPFFLSHDTAVAVVGVLAQTHVGDNDKIVDPVLDCLYRLRDYVVFLVPLASGRVFLRWDAKQDYPRNAQVGHFHGFFHDFIDRELVIARHGGNFLAYSPAGTHEERHYQVVDRKSGFPYHAPEVFARPQPARAVDGISHMSASRSGFKYGPRTSRPPTQILADSETPQFPTRGNQVLISSSVR